MTRAPTLWGECEISWSPDGYRIVYSAEGKTWTVSAGGGTPEEVKTGLTARHASLALSPDGTKIAFNATQGGEPELWLIEDFLPPVKARR